MARHVINATCFCLLLALFSPESFACAYPDEGNMPLRRAASRVSLLPETEAWSAAERRDGQIVHYAVLLERTIVAKGRCHWTVEARTIERLWQRFYVTPDGASLLVQGVNGAPVTLEQWRGQAARPAPSRSAGATAGAS